jgi:hypothetical protein
MKDRRIALVIRSPNQPQRPQSPLIPEMVCRIRPPATSSSHHSGAHAYDGAERLILRSCNLLYLASSHFDGSEVRVAAYQHLAPS